MYNRHCYFCHAYAGDARTQAARYLSPPPANLQTLPPEKQTAKFLRQTILLGKSGTAMMGFKGRLKSKELEHLIVYLQQGIFHGKKNLVYHSAENGWPDHGQYAAAFPFVEGKLSAHSDYTSLSPVQQYGWFLYTQRCIICHEQGDGEKPVLEPYAVSYPRSYSMKDPGPKDTQGELQVDVISSATPYAKHEEAPAPVTLSAQEKQGETLFQANCAFCHAPDGTGRNWIGSFIQPRPRNFNDPQQMGRFDHRSLKSAIMNGVSGSAMPAWKTVLNEEQVEAIIAYIAKVFYPALNRK